MKLLLEKMFVFKKTLVFEKYPLSHHYPHFKNEVKVSVRPAGYTDILKLKRSFEKFKGGKADKRLGNGHLCFVAEKNGNIIHYSWVAFKEIYLKESDRKLQLESDAAYFYDAYTIPEYRGIGICPMVLTKISEHLLKNGIKRAYFLINSNNYPSLRVAEKIGSRNIGEIILIRLFKLRKLIFKSKTFEDYIKMKKMFSF